MPELPIDPFTLRRISRKATFAVRSLVAPFFALLASSGAEALLPQVAAPAGVSAGAGAGETPRRLLKRFDFEDAEEFPTEMPQGFYRVLTSESGQPGFPPFGRVALVRAGANANANATQGNSASAPKGHWSLSFQLDGAAIAVASSPALIPLTNRARPQVSAQIHTSGLLAAGVRLTARFVNSAGEPMPGAWATAPLRSEQGWRKVELEMPEAPDGATSMTVEVAIVQPDGASSSDGLPARRDVTGTAFIDDLVVWQLPTAEFAATRGGIFSVKDIPQLTITCRDPVATKLTVRVVVRDVAGVIVARKDSALQNAQEMSVALGSLAPGWYSADAHFLDEGQRIAARRAQFCIVPDDSFEADQPPRFGVVFPESASHDYAKTIAQATLARASFVVLPVWSANTDLGSSTLLVHELRTLTDALFAKSIRPMFRIEGIPAALATSERLDSSQVVDLFASEGARWRGALEPWLIAFGQQVTHWFLGAEGLDPSAPELQPKLLAASDALRNFIAGPAVVTPWMPEEPMPESIASDLKESRAWVELPLAPGWSLAAGDAPLTTLPPPERIFATIEPLPASLSNDMLEIAPRDRAIDIALRTIDAWSTGIASIAIVADESSEVPGPSIGVAAWRQLSTRLCGRHFVSEVPLGEGLRGILADGPRGACLIAWNESRVEGASVKVALGRSTVIATDLWGRVQQLAPSAEGHALALVREPVFVEGVEREVLQFRAAVRVEPASIDARRAPQPIAIVLKNPWNYQISGTLLLPEVEDAEIAPRSMPFSIAPLGETKVEVALGIPRSRPSGEFDLRPLAQVSGNQEHAIPLSAVVETGFSKVSLESSWRLAKSVESDRIDLVVSAKVTNVSSTPLDVEAFAVADGYTQNRKPIENLQPGQSAVRVFHFPAGARRLSGRDVRVGVQDSNLDARLLKLLPIPPFVPPSAVVGVGD